jgi:hypothetical protein
MLLSGAKSGYISSNRPGGKGSDDGYCYSFNPSSIKILVSDAKTGKPIQGATVTVFRDSVQLDKSVMGSQGSHVLSLKPCKSYKFLVDAKNFYSQEALAEIDCPIRENSELVFRLKRPALKVIAFNKYLLSMIPGASVYVKDQTDTTLEQSLCLTNDQGEAEFDLIPGHAYEVTLDKQGLPQTLATFIAPKKEADPDVELRMGTGIPPVRGVLVKFFVKEEQTGTPVNNARVRLFNPETQEIMDVMTNELGYYETIFKENTAWTVSASRIGYFSTSKSKSSFDVKKYGRRFRKINLGTVPSVKKVYNTLPGETQNIILNNDINFNISTEGGTTIVKQTEFVLGFKESVKVSASSSNVKTTPAVLQEGDIVPTAEGSTIMVGDVPLNIVSTTPTNKIYPQNEASIIVSPFDDFVKFIFYDNSLQEATARERYYYELLKPTMNHNCPGRSATESQKEYYKINAETIRAKQAQYSKEYYKINYETIRAKYNCECGGRYTHGHRARHFDSAKHKKYIEELTKEN